LPEVEGNMSHRFLTGVEKDSPEFYYNALQYGHYLWQTGHAGRAILAVTRALYADLPEEAPILKDWPLPYAALKWIVAKQHTDDFPGNPRVSFQHQATRLRGPRQDLRRARAWAVWALIRKARPNLPGDPHDPVEEPAYDEIFSRLSGFGNTGEAELWQKTLRQS
jgi:hypothetical protein